MPQPYLRTKGEEIRNEDICLFAETTFRNQPRRFGIKLDDRRRHMYVIGKTGMGKTTMLENMVLGDIYKGHGVGIVDPHGDFAEKIIDFIPPSRINDVVYFNPGDMDYPIGFNVLEITSEEQKHLITAGLMGIFKKIWPDVWSSRMEYILNNTILALLDYPGSTLLGINRLLADKSYRLKVIRQLKDPVIKAFWQTEFASYNDRYAQEAVAPIQNKIGQFLSASVIRNMVAQVKSTINVREIMDTEKIFIMNLSKGRIGEDNSRLLGGMLITKIQLAAMERVDTPEADRKDFFLYVDEFQNFATPSFANILSEARKYRLSLIMAHQYVKQLDEIVGDAVFGNVGTIAAFRVGGMDAETLAKEFAPTFIEEDIVNLTKFQIILKLMIDGVASQPFSAHTIPPIGSPTGMSEKIIRVSRERYGKKREVIEDKIIRWSGMSALQDDFDADIEPEKKDEEPRNVVETARAEGRVISLNSLLPPTGEISGNGNRPNQTKTDVNKNSVPETILKPMPSAPTASPRFSPSPSRPPILMTSTPDANSGLNGLPGVKKKRKRHRKKKNGSGLGDVPNFGNGNFSSGRDGSTGNNFPKQSENLQQGNPTPLRPVLEPPTPAASSTKPETETDDSDTSKINPNQIIKFD
ncbi:MAG: type IV secretion system DNA-binding domain-containing protein [Patescibacteria group bacterium]